MDMGSSYLVVVLAPQRQVNQLEGYHSAASLRLSADPPFKLDRDDRVAVGDDFFESETKAGEIADSTSGVAYIRSGLIVGPGAVGKRE
jgi:hypothetical protein